MIMTNGKDSDAAYFFNEYHPCKFLIICKQIPNGWLFLNLEQVEKPLDKIIVANIRKKTST